MIDLAGVVVRVDNILMNIFAASREQYGAIDGDVLRSTLDDRFHRRPRAIAMSLGVPGPQTGPIMAG